MTVSFFGWHFIQCFQQHTQPGIVAEKIPVFFHKPPEQTIPYILPGSFVPVTHFKQVIAAADIGLGGHQSSVGKLGHITQS